jgi:hypothetical protein
MKSVIIIAVAIVVAVLIGFVNWGITYDERMETIEIEKQAQLIYEKEVVKCWSLTESEEEVTYYYDEYADKISIPKHVENCMRDAINKGIEFQCGSDDTNTKYDDCVNAFFKNSP